MDDQVNKDPIKDPISKAPIITMKGWNPAFEAKMSDFRTIGYGYAESSLVQFNVNKDVSAGGALFVAPNNDGVVVFSMISDHVFTDAWALYPASQNLVPLVEIAKKVEKKQVTFNARTAESESYIFTTSFVLQFAQR